MSNLKKLILERQAKTGESYQTAHRFVTGAHRNRSGGSSEPPDDRKVYSREDIRRCAEFAPDQVGAVLGTLHKEEAHISYERVNTAVSLRSPLSVGSVQFVTMTAVDFQGERAWAFNGRVDALWGGPEPESPAKLAVWLKDDLRADHVQVHSFKGNVADVTAHWIAKPRTINEAAVNALADEILGTEQLAAAARAEGAELVTYGSELAYDSEAFFDGNTLFDSGKSEARAPGVTSGALVRTALLSAGVPEDELQKWDGELLGLRRITGGASAVLWVAQQQAADNAREGAFALDLGHYSTKIPREKGEALERFLLENQISFDRVRSLGAEWVAKKTGTKARYRGM